MADAVFDWGSFDTGLGDFFDGGGGDGGAIDFGGVDAGTGTTDVTLPFFNSGDGILDPNTDPLQFFGGVPGDGFIDDSGFDSNVDSATIDWCNNNPGNCDAYGPTDNWLSLYCTDLPDHCGIDQSTQQSTAVNPQTGVPIGSSNPSRASGGTSGGGGSGSGGGGKSGGGSGSQGANPLAQLGQLFGNLLKGLLGGNTCPAGTARAQNGQCIRPGTSGQFQSAGILGGMSLVTLVIIAVAIIYVIKE